MMHSLQSSAGAAAGLISLLAYFPYARDIVRGVARPDRATWLIWSVVGGLLFASYAAAAGGAALWVPLSDALGPALIAVLTIRSGEGGLSRFDYGCLVAAGLSLIGWALTGSPMVSLAVGLLLDLLGALPTFHSVYQDPASEPAFVWRVFLLGNVLNLVAIQQWSWRSAAYPVYVVLASGLVNVLICRRGPGKLSDRDRPTLAFARQPSDGVQPG